MAYEPRPVPPVEGLIEQTAWYCLDCGQKHAIRNAIDYHWITVHGSPNEKPCEGIDVVIGSQLITMSIRRSAWIDAQAKHFLQEMHAEFGPEDFVAEAEIRDA